jgi:ankyrin repeat protein
MKPKLSPPDIVVVAILGVVLITPDDATAQRPSKQQATIAAPVLTVDEFALAVVNDRDAEVKAMLARGMDPETVGPDGNPVLVTAAREGSARVIDVLLAAGAKVDSANAYGDTALKLAALRGHLAIAKKLRARGAAVETPGWTPLIYAATGGHDDMVRYLIAEGAKLDAVSPNGTTALMMAVREEKFSTAELLIARGANVNIRNENGASALDWAERSGDSVMVERLKRAGAR